MYNLGMIVFGLCLAIVVTRNGCTSVILGIVTFFLVGNSVLKTMRPKKTLGN